MTEYEMKIREAANDVKYLLHNTGAIYSTMVYSLISILLSKKKINNDDLDVILEVLKANVKTSVKSYVESNYGQENSAITTTEDVKAVEKLCMEYVEELKNNIIEIAKEITPKKTTRRRKPRAKKEIVVKEEKKGIHDIIPIAEVEVNYNQKNDNIKKKGRKKKVEGK
jgi:hypothetical protein